MNKNGGTATIALIVAALFGFSYMPRGGSDVASQTEKGTESPLVSAGRMNLPGAKSELNQPCVAIGRVLGRFFEDADRVPYPDSCFGLAKPIENKSSKKPDLKIVIALISDPVHTHFSLYFDRAVETIQQAAQDEGYRYDSSWFPWRDDPPKYQLLADDIESRERQRTMEKQPGVMVFRGEAGRSQGTAARLGEWLTPYDRGLVVFVVGEEPTGGITDEQFENAIKWRQALGASGSQPLRILGPASSGTLPSLERELVKTKADWSPQSGLEIYSGSVSSLQGVKSFCETLGGTLGTNPVDGSCVNLADGSKLDFRTFNESDEIKLERFCHYLGTTEHYDLGRLAILSEDETAFGGMEDKEEKKAQGSLGCIGQGKQKPIYLYYPRDIAALRAAYDQQSIFGNGRSPSNVPSTTLRGGLTEPAGEHDTVRSYGGQLDAVAQESILFGIVERLRQRRVEFVLLRSSNTIDQVFLSQFLRRALPEARVVLDGADLLLVRSGQGISLRGVMALSTYPLLSRQQLWTHTLRAGHNGSYRVFGQDAVEGLYLAARAQIA